MAGFWESRIVVQKLQSLLAGGQVRPLRRRENTTLMNQKSDICARKSLFLLDVASAPPLLILIKNN
jgi:hypothetical protein